MNTKGFTLAELLGVIVILLALSLLAFPPILNRLNITKVKINDATLKVYASALDEYLDSNHHRYEFLVGNTYCIKLKSLVDDGKLVKPLKDSVSGKDISEENYFLVSKKEDEFDYSVSDTKPNDCIDLSFTNYVITFDPVGGTVVRSSKIVTNGYEYGSMPIASKEGYTFDGWYTSVTDGEKIEDTDIVQISNNITLYAHYTSE